MCKKVWKNLILFLTVILCILGLAGCGAENAQQPAAASVAEDKERSAQAENAEGGESSAQAEIAEDGEYTSKEDVALYLHTYQKLPSNYITKKEARALGWEGGPVEPYAPGKSIGGDHFGNYEGQLPEKKGRSYTECDIDTRGKPRGAKRIIFSNDGLIYYTDDHYETFTLLYGEE